MKNLFPSSIRPRLAVLLGCALLFCASAGAQNLLQNPGFESPLDPWDPTMQTGGKTNWTLVYVSGGPGDFSIKDRTTDASHNGPTGHGAHLRPKTDWWCHAYFTQTVSNLNTSANYYVNGYINRLYQLGALDTYFEVAGVVTNSVHTPQVSNMGWVQFSVSNNVPRSNGTLEVRLHLNKNATAWAPDPGEEKYWTTDAMFDDFYLAPQ